MSAPITITISGPTGIGTLTIAQTIWHALNEACLDVQWPNGGPHVAITTLYEQQTKLAMAGTRCIVKSEVSLSSRDAQPDLPIASLISRATAQSDLSKSA